METNVVIDATELFGAKKESGHIDLDSINDYLANGSETQKSNAQAQPHHVRNYADHSTKPNNTK